MSWLLNFPTSIFIMVVFIVLIQIRPIYSVYDQSPNSGTIYPQQYSPQANWKLELNQTSAKVIVQNEIENLKRLFQFGTTNSNNNVGTDNNHIRNLTRTLDALFNIQDNSDDDESQPQQRPFKTKIQKSREAKSKIPNQDENYHSSSTSPSDNKLFDLNALLFLGLMFLILVLITLYLLNSWSLRLDRRASIQTKTADNHKQPYKISV